MTSAHSISRMLFQNRSLAFWRQVSRQATKVLYYSIVAATFVFVSILVTGIHP
jgi:hypothetical protein